MTGGEHIHRRGAPGSLSGQDLHQPTLTRPQDANDVSNSIQTHDPTNTSPMMDTESQYSEETMVGSRPVEMSTRVSRAFATFSFWERLNGKRKKRVGWSSSFKTIATFTWLNVLLIFVPIAWSVKASGYKEHILQFLLCFCAIIPLSKLLDYGGEQLALYCGKDLGDLIVITLNNAVETATALVLMVKCELKLLQSTIIGVALLRLLLVPGTAFLVGGARTSRQELHPHISQLNNTLLIVGALTLLLPVAFFGALNHNVQAGVSNTDVVSDAVRGDFLKISRALSVFLLVTYICSRFYLHDPPGVRESLHEREDAPESFKAAVQEMERVEPDVNPWVCIILLAITAVFIGFTTEFLVQSVRPMRHRLNIKEEWFGLFLLPMVSYSADGILSVGYFIRRNLVVQRYLGAPAPICRLAQGRSIDLGIQFLIFWMPFLVLVGWFSHKPMALLFDLFEVCILLGACFLVNYVTADAKTNWCEGMIMVTFYFMICVSAWFYPGQPEVRDMITCASVHSSLSAHNSTLATSGTQEDTTKLTGEPQRAIVAPQVHTINKRLERLLEIYGVEA